MADPECLARLAEVASRLARTALNCPVGASSYQSSRGPAMPTVVELCQTKERIETEILNHKITLKAVEGRTNSEEAPEKILERIEGLQEELQETAIDTELRQSMISRLKLGQKLISVVLEAEEEDGGGENPCTRSIRHQVEELTDLSSRVLTLHKHMCESLQPTLNIEKHNVDLKHENRRLLETLQKSQKAKEKVALEKSQSPAIQQMEKQVELQEAKVDVMRQVLQGLILGSGVHWAADDDLRNTVLNLGESNEAVVL